MKKRVVLLLFILVIIFSSQTFTSSAADSPTTIKVGDYISFGKYYGDPILWRVININKDGSAMLFSEKILCLKPFDSAESGVAGEIGGSYTVDEFRKKYGSNRWSSSNLRDWLNSNQNIVKYTTQPPIENAVYGGMNDYASEPGFLSNFTEKEQTYIVPIEHKCLLSEVDKGKKNGGNKAYKADSNISNAVKNYGNSYYENVKDKVFIPDAFELYNYVSIRGWDYTKLPTTKALNNSENFWDGKNINEYYKKKLGKGWFYWLRTPATSYSSSMRYVNVDGHIDEIGVISGSCGVAPAINLKAGKKIYGGNGSIGKPYITNEEININTPARPTALSAIRNGRSIKVNWNSSKYADKYYVYFKSTKETIVKTTNTTSLTVTALSVSNNYSIYVIAINSAGKSDPSNTVTINH